MLSSYSGHETSWWLLLDVVNFPGANRSMVNKPKEFAHLLRDKFGSADQINMLGMLTE